MKELLTPAGSPPRIRTPRCWGRRQHTRLLARMDLRAFSVYSSQGMCRLLTSVFASLMHF